MANSKISALTSATTPLAGTETLPIVQGGATVKTTVANITNGGGYAGAFTTLSATGVTTVQAGTALLPAITTSGDTNTGIWFPAADTIAFTEGGVESMRISSAGNVGIGTSAPSAKLDLSDATNPVYLQQTRGSVVQLAGPTGTAVTSPGQIGTTSNSPFRIITNSTARITTDETGNVGIGTTSPSGLLHLSANTAATTAPTIVLQDTGTTATRLGTLTNDSGDLVLAMTASLTDLRSAITLFDDRKITFTTNAAEKARIDSVGNIQVQAGAVMPYAPAPASISTTATLTNANIQAQIINTTGTSYTVTMPLGTTLETLATWVTTNVAYDFFVINTATGVITMAVNTGVTSLGSLTVAIGASAHFRIRRTAANTFVLYRLA
jgi:hypothetical protein